MLTSLKLKRGEGKLVGGEGSQEEPKKRTKKLPQYPPPSTPPKEVEATLSKSHREGEIHEEADPKEEERVFRK